MSDASQDFLFERELAEVYLLMDHISGREDKSLASLLKRKVGPDGPSLIEDVCAIHWPLETGAGTIQAQAATLLRAKDELNGLAYPATGATIAFTVLVTGDSADMSGAPAPAARPVGAQVSPPKAETRMDLAERAYPGLKKSARSFRRYRTRLNMALFVWLIFTCALSWNIAQGHAILVRLDSLKLAKADIDAGLDTELVRSGPSAPAVPPGQVQSPLGVAIGSAVSRMLGVQPCGDPTSCTCEKAILSDVAPPNVLRMCERNQQSKVDFQRAYAELADWKVGWSWLLKAIPNARCGEQGCLDHGPTEKPLTRNATDELWSSIITEVLANAVLPVVYGILGSGAAIVRGFQSKIRDSLLAPREIVLALGQLALGAVVGACIGLFVSPNSGGNGGLVSGVTLSASALSFIAGFGVEDVFLAMESFIGRIFNTRPRNPPPARAA